MSGRDKWFAGVATLVVLVAVGAGVAVLDPPSMQRARKLDQHRVRDLAQLTRHIKTYARENAATLPPALSALPAHAAGALSDPDTGQPYGYEAKDANTYNLCATFALASDASDLANHHETYGSPDWQHGKGRHCFTLDLSKAY